MKRGLPSAIRQGAEDGQTPAVDVAQQHSEKRRAGYATEKDRKTQGRWPSLEAPQDQAGNRSRTAQSS